MTRKTIHVAVMILTHDRGEHHALRICLKYLENRLAAECVGVVFTPVIFHSGCGDAELVTSSGYNATLLSNDMPLGQRHNLAMDRLLNMEWDYVMQLGSDDVLTPSGYLTAAIWMRHGVRFASFMHVGLVDPLVRKYVPHTSPANMGAGRFMRRRDVEKSHRSPEHVGAGIWKDHKLKGLDGDSEHSLLERAGAVCHPIHTHNICVWDFKSNDNLHSFEKFATGHKTVEFDNSVLTV
jgi:hypothetical protein